MHRFFPPTRQGKNNPKKNHATLSQCEEEKMKAKVDENLCTGCGLCADTCPEVFEMGDATANVKLETIPTDLEDTTREAAENCPVEAITLE